MWVCVPQLHLQGSVCLILEGRGVRLRWAAGMRGWDLVLVFWTTPPPSSPSRAGEVRSVPQDDFHKAGHVGLFGLMGGEEGMLLRRREEEEEVS